MLGGPFNKHCCINALCALVRLNVIPAKLTHRNIKNIRDVLQRGGNRNVARPAHPCLLTLFVTFSTWPCRVTTNKFIGILHSCISRIARKLFKISQHILKSLAYQYFVNVPNTASLHSISKWWCGPLWRQFLDMSHWMPFGILVYWCSTGDPLV